MKKIANIDYSIFNYCAECKKKYPKKILWCTEQGCHKKLRTNGIGYARRMEVARIK